MLNNYVINIENNIDSKFGDYVRTSNDLGRYEYVLRAVIKSYETDEKLQKSYKIIHKFLKECNWYSIQSLLYLMLCDSIIYDGAITEQLRNIYTFFNYVPNTFKESVYNKLLLKYNMMSIYNDHIDIGKMLPDKEYLSSSFQTRFDLIHGKNELSLKDNMLKFKKKDVNSDKLVMYENEILGYTDVISICNKKLTYLFIRKSEVEFRQVRYNKDNGFIYESINKDSADRIDKKEFGKILFV